MRTGIGISPACQASWYSMLQRSVSCRTNASGLTLFFLLPNGPALSCAPPVHHYATTGGRPASRPRTRPPAGWKPWQAPGRRRVSCSALSSALAHLRRSEANSSTVMPASRIRARRVPLATSR